jgi:hypothetical protein
MQDERDIPPPGTEEQPPYDGWEELPDVPVAGHADTVDERPEPTPTDSNVILERLDGGEWTPLQDVAPTTEDVAAVIALISEGVLEYSREPETRRELLRKV